MKPTVDHIVMAIGRFGYRFNSEEELQEGLAIALKHSGVDCAREVVLTPRDRIDFLVGNVGIEVKIKGGISGLTEQLFRYTALPQIAALVVVVGKNTLGNLPRKLNGKPIQIVRVSRAFA